MTWEPGDTIVLRRETPDPEHVPQEYLLIVVCSCGKKHLANPA